MGLRLLLAVLDGDPEAVDVLLPLEDGFVLLLRSERAGRLLPGASPGRLEHLQLLELGGRLRHGRWRGGWCSRDSGLGSCWCRGGGSGRLGGRGRGRSRLGGGGRRGWR